MQTDPLEELKKEAYDEGYDDGLKDGRAELEDPVEDPREQAADSTLGEFRRPWLLEGGPGGWRILAAGGQVVMEGGPTWKDMHLTDKQVRAMVALVNRGAEL